MAQLHHSFKSEKLYSLKSILQQPAVIRKLLGAENPIPFKRCVFCAKLYLGK